MNIVTVDGKQYDLDAVSAVIREHIEQLLFLGTDLAKHLTPPAELQAKIDASTKALALALRSAA